MRGFSLIELLVVSAVGFLAGFLLILFLVQNNGLFVDQAEKASQGLSLNDSLAEIRESVRNASAVVANYPLTQPYQYTSGTQTLIISIPSIDSSSNIIDKVYDFLVITKDSQNPKILKKLVFPSINPPSFRKSENKILTTSLKSIIFSYLDNNGNTIIPTFASRINFTINLSETLGQQTRISSGSGEINLRNN